MKNNKCVICGKEFQTTRKKAKYCGSTCRKRKFDRKKKGNVFK